MTTKEMMKNIVIPCLFLFLLASCINEDMPIDDSFMTIKPSEPIVWYGIQPGEVIKEDEIVSILSELDFIAGDSITVNRTNYSWIDSEDQIEIVYQCKGYMGKYCGGVVAANDIVVSIWMNIHYSLKIEQAFDLLGKPDFMSCVELPGEFMSRKISFYWIDMGIIVNNIKKTSCLRDQDSLEVYNSPVTSIEYTINEKMDFLLDQDFLYEWKGYPEQID